MPERRPVSRSRTRAVQAAIAGLVLTAAAALTHGWSLTDGLFFDDHLHFYKLAHLGWSWDDLNEVTVVNPAHFIEMWWQTQQVHWQYGRPLAVLVAKVIVTRFSDAAVLMHLLSIALHLVSAWCVYRLLYLLTRRPGWALAGGYLFIVYSHSVYTVSWLASQNAVLQTALTLMALLAYLRASGLQPCPYPYIPRSQMNAVLRPVPSFRLGWGAAALLLWLLAIGARENALILPVIAWAFDLAFGGRAQVRRRMPVYALMAGITIACIIWRFTSAYHPYPDFYVRGYDGPTYIPWVLVKLLHYVFSVVFQSPMIFGPTLRHNPITETPGDCLLMLAIVAVMGLGYYLACREVRGYWIWPLWIVLSLLPVIPVMATPHNGYMPGVGFCIALMLAPAMRDRVHATSIGRWSKPVAIFFLMAITCYFPIYRTMWNAVRAAERLTIHEMMEDFPAEKTRHVFFIDLPFVNVYAQLHWAELTHQTDPLNPLPHADATINPAPRWHVLTFANNVLCADRRVTLTQISPHAFSLKVIEGRPFFSGAMGRFLIEAMREHRRFQTGQVINGDLFDVRILRADAEGVWEMEFTFDRPLHDAEYAFYIATPDRAATRLTFTPNRPAESTIEEAPSGLTPDMLPLVRQDYQEGDYSSGLLLLNACRTRDDELRRRAWDAFCREALPVAQAKASPIRNLLDREDVKPSTVQVCLEWWTSRVDPRTFRAVARDDPVGEGLRDLRNGLFRIHSLAARIIEADSYLTGPPYPGPR